MHFFKHACLFFRWFGSSEITLFIYIRHNNLIISYLDIKVTHVSYMKTLLPLTFFSFNSQQYSSLSTWLCTHISNFLLILSSNLFAVLLVTAREELGHFISLIFRGFTIKCVYRVWTYQHTAFLWEKCHKPGNDGSIWQGSQEGLAEREILSTMSSSEPQICY